MKNSSRNNIIKEAKKLFSMCGYNNTSMKQIAECAGVNEITIYRNFGTKENLFQEITNKYIEDIHVIDRVCEIKEEPIENVVNYIAEWFIKYCFENEIIYKIQLKIEHGNDGFVKLKLTKNFIDATENYLNYLNKEKSCNYNSRSYAKAFISGMLGTFTVYALDSEFFPSESVVPTIDIQTKSFIKLLEDVKE